jgi:hypothetical protein
MLKKYALLVLIFFTVTLLKAQFNYRLNKAAPKFFDGNVEIESPFWGGFNSPQFQPFDLNGDKSMDVIVFDRYDSKILPFVRKANDVFQYAPEYTAMLPKGLYYYKVNKPGIRLNRSAKIMHDKFKELLTNFTISEKFIEPLCKQLTYTFENLTETNTNEKKSLSLQLKNLEDELYNLRKRHAFGQISLDVFEEFSAELSQQKEEILKEIEKLNQKISNPEKLIKFAV